MAKFCEDVNLESSMGGLWALSALIEYGVGVESVARS